MTFRVEDGKAHSYKGILLVKTLKERLKKAVEYLRQAAANYQIFRGRLSSEIV